MQANYRSYRQPEKHIFKLLEKWWNYYHGRGSALRIGLDLHTGGKNREKDLASIAAIEKTWTHRFIDSHDHLRRLFAKASTFSTPPTASETALPHVPELTFHAYRMMAWANNCRQHCSTPRKMFSVQKPFFSMPASAACCSALSLRSPMSIAKPGSWLF
jgi:hypothetical protein